ncbi:hypothetical protein [Streptomyces sp. NPDC021020]|uniref:hypothetical protein n=1 Tax=Streptomyces sp. NPDC021020 TaxID=3365109 RepID=UPI0037BBE5FE
MRQGLRTAHSTRRPQAALGALALAVALGGLGTLSACTGGGSDDADGDGKSSLTTDQSVSPAPPGKYKTLPQPCIAVDLDTLKAVVPGAKDYAGTESLTYDTDRRVGCSWHAKNADGADHALTIDMERVVSYDPAVSDEVEAKGDFDAQAALASIPPLPLPGSTPTTPPSATTTPTASGTPSGSPDSTGGTGAGDSAGTDSPGDSGQNWGPRRLTDVGNAAFIYDTLTPAKGGKGVARRDVTLVFRTANVVVSIRYAAASAPAGDAPQSSDVQQSAQKVAKQLERKVES